MVHLKTTEALDLFMFAHSNADIFGKTKDESKTVRALPCDIDERVNNMKSKSLGFLRKNLEV